MSFGALSANAVTALNRGAALAGCLQNSGEGSISPYHRSGGELVYQIGSGYFGCRDEHGRFDLARLKDTVASAPGARAGGQAQPGRQAGARRGAARASRCRRRSPRRAGCPQGVDCVSPSRHAEFSDVDGLLDFVEMLADETGLPVGIKAAVGDLAFWHELVRLMADTGRGVDHVTIDGGEGGTGAAPLVFADSVSLPFRLGFSRVYRIFAEAGLHERVVFVGSGKLGLPENAVVAFALGADLVNVGREAMLAVGCIQAQKCHTDHCPTGVATQNPWLARGLDPTLKSVRCANYIRTLRRDLLKLAEATGVEHPGLIGCRSVEILTGPERRRRRCTRCTATTPPGASRRRSTAPRSPGSCARRPRGRRDPGRRRLPRGVGLRGQVSPTSATARPSRAGSAPSGRGGSPAARPRPPSGRTAGTRPVGRCRRGPGRRR